MTRLPWAQLDSSVSFTSKKGYKKTSWVTIMFSASADGFDLEKSVVVGKVTCPRNSKEKVGYDPRDTDVRYYYHSNAWMTRYYWLQR